MAEIVIWGKPDGIIERLYRGTTNMMDNVFDWILENDEVAITGTPTRMILTLTPIEGGTPIVCDTNDAAYDLGTPGTTEHFRWTAGTGTLIVDLGGEAIAGFPEGSYTVELDWYDSSNTNGIRWGHQEKFIIVF